MQIMEDNYMKWKYVLQLDSEDVFDEIAKKRKIVFPEDLKELIREANAGSPEKSLFMVKNNEKVFGAVLCFNRGVEDADSVFTALDVIEDTNLLPFAIDPAGNYICINVDSGNVIYWDHEADAVTELDMKLDGFVSSLYS